jgi:hypothetical protein
MPDAHSNREAGARKPIVPTVRKSHLPHLYATSRAFADHLTEMVVWLPVDRDNDDGEVDVSRLIELNNGLRLVMRLPHVRAPRAVKDRGSTRYVKGPVCHLRMLTPGERPPTFDFYSLPSEAIAGITTIKAMVGGAPDDSWCSPAFVQALGEYWYAPSNVIRFRRAVQLIDRHLPEAAKYVHIHARPEAATLPADARREPLAGGGDDAPDDRPPTLATPHEAPPKPTRKGGRPRDTDADEDRRIAEAWGTGAYAAYSELAAALGKTDRDVELTIDRHRKRESRRAGQTRRMNPRQGR